MVTPVTLTVPVAKVLAALLREPGSDRYGLDLMNATGLPSGTLYPILVRLTRAGWVDRHWEEVDPVAAARPARRYYRLTPDGAARAAHELAGLRGLATPGPGAVPAAAPEPPAGSPEGGRTDGGRSAGGRGGGAPGRLPGQARPAW
jgi:PadR family transcriptional regulator PadR